MAPVHKIFPISIWPIQQLRNLILKFLGRIARSNMRHSDSFKTFGDEMMDKLISSQNIIAALN